VRKIKVYPTKVFSFTIDIVFALAEQNRERFDIVRAVIGKYLEKCGRRYVSLGGIFGFMT